VNTVAVVLGFLMCALGMTIGFVLLEPLGFILDGLGFMVFLYGIFAKQEVIVTPERRTSLEERNKCGNCTYFGLESCPRHERWLIAFPCEKFYYEPSLAKQNIIELRSKAKKPVSKDEEESQIASSDPKLKELVGKLSEKFIYPERAVKGLIESKMRLGKTKEQAIKEIEEENT